MRTRSGGGGQNKSTTKGTLAKQDYLMASLKCYLPYGFQVMTLLLFFLNTASMCVVDDGLGQTKEHIKVFPAFL